MTLKSGIDKNEYETMSFPIEMSNSNNGIVDIGLIIKRYRPFLYMIHLKN